MENNLKTTNLPLYTFLESCLEEKGVTDIPEDLKSNMITDLSDRLQKWLLQSIFMHISESAAAELEKLMESGASQEEIMEFLQTSVPNVNNIFGEEMLKFKEAYLGK
jgi:uncharacterized hydantoinase/oxoprolinase family protein